MIHCQALFSLKNIELVGLGIELLPGREEYCKSFLKIKRELDQQKNA